MPLRLDAFEERLVPATAELSLRSLLGSTPATVEPAGEVTADLGGNRLAVEGSAGVVRVLDARTRQELVRLVPYGDGFTGAVRVAAGDVTGDGVPDLVTAPGTGGGPHVRAFDGVNFVPVADFLAYSNDFRGGVSLAVADVTGDRIADFVTGAGPGGGPHVRVFDGRTREVIREVFAFDPTFAGGINVAAGDTDGDGFAEIAVAAGAGGGPRVRLFSGRDFFQLQDFFAYPPEFRGGVNVAIGLANDLGRPSLVTGTDGGGGRVNFFDAETRELQKSFDTGRSNGVRVFVGDFTGDGIADLLPVIPRVAVPFAD